ncbi:cobalamin-independent methionine synthase II family protein [Nesterenkonia alkaliphila]|uniref:Epoxyalkane--coenzyme M transferase n=1 Tax=Nesterenkonia alkaliphila TaxID=1463631 RepID=A0A7K1ULB4_9MICC|nr:cobalamin-independent methionine synthase II family protein [Nesterenkonia alkaliphila]MVT27278.1 epoxyalkane--coenzyme M transferase [Nesterenkonia alkaliphila]GFZ78136.1 methionine synthase [Nesterenkonia alkaliphila]
MPAVSQDPNQQILTSHAGSLPRTPELIEANAAREFEEDGFTLKRTPEFERLLAEAVKGLVARQKEQGITVPGDGEFGKAMSSAVDYGAWWSYIFQRVEGLELTGEDLFTWPHYESSPGDIKLTNMLNRRDWVKFADAYADPASGIATGKTATDFPAITGPLKYKGQEQIQQDVQNFRAALDAAGYETGFITSLAPGCAGRIADDYYSSEEERIYAWADVLREEYKAIIDAGLIVQLDDPSIAENWDQISPEPSVADYRKFTQLRIEAANYALRDLPEEQIRFHLCWGSWHGPHTTDIEFKHIVDLMLQVNAKYYSFEAANVRHEHEYTVWEDVKLPEGKVIVPGIVSHATNVVEHPELVAQRITRFAERVGRENVIAATDCGLGGRIHPQIANAKLEALGEGAKLATEQLW